MKFSDIKKKFEALWNSIRFRTTARNWRWWVTLPIVIGFFPFLVLRAGLSYLEDKFCLIVEWAIDI